MITRSAQPALGGPGAGARQDEATALEPSAEETTASARPALEETGARPFRPETASEPSSERAWQTAQQRAVLYLNRLHVQPKKALECALKAVQRAEQTPGIEPVAGTMIALRSVLEEEGIFRGRADELLLPRGGTVPGVQVAPTVRRGIMVPVPMDRRPWVAFLSRCLRWLKISRPAAPKSSPEPATDASAAGKPSDEPATDASAELSREQGVP